MGRDTPLDVAERPRSATGPVAGVVGGLAVLLVLLLLVEAAWAPLARLDERVLAGLHEAALASPALVLVADVVSVLGSTGAYAVVLGALAVALWRRGRARDAVFVVVAVAGGRLLNAGAKALVDRPRPDLPDPVGQASSSAFPSGHAQGVVVAAGVLVALGVRRRAVLVGLAGWVLVMGLARVVLGVHAPSDVVAGWGLGLAWVTAVAATLLPAPARRREAAGPPPGRDGGGSRAGHGAA